MKSMSNWWRTKPEAEPLVPVSETELAVRHVWDRIERWLAAHAPRVYKALGPAASEAAIGAVETELGLRFPADYRVSLRIHDGERKNVGVIHGFQLNSLELLIQEYRVMAQVLTAGSFAQFAAETNEPGLKPGYWRQSWLPIASDRSANHYLMDLDPAPEGSLGQVFVFDHEQGAEPVEAPSFLAWLQRYAEWLESGRIIWRDGELRVDMRA